MTYKAYIPIDPAWTEAEQQYAQEILLHRIAKALNLPFDHVREHTTIKQREFAADGPCFFAEYDIGSPAVLIPGRWPYGLDATYGIDEQ